MCVNSLPVGWFISFNATFPVGLKTFPLSQTLYIYTHTYTLTLKKKRPALEHETVTNVVLMVHD